MKIRPVPLALAAAMVLSTVPALAQPPGGAGRFILRFMDANRDGQVSREEFVEFRQNRAGSQFDQADADRDGTLSREEFLQLQADDARSRFSRMDRNGDGYWGLDEMPGAGGMNGGGEMHDGMMPPPDPATN